MVLALSKILKSSNFNTGSEYKLILGYLLFVEIALIAISTFLGVVTAPKIKSFFYSEIDKGINNHPSWSAYKKDKIRNIIKPVIGLTATAAFLRNAWRGRSHGCSHMVQCPYLSRQRVDKSARSEQVP